MKIAVLTRCLYSGGTERVIAKLSLIWSRLGHEVYFFTLLPENATDYPYECKGRIRFDDHGNISEQIKEAYEKFQFDLFVFNSGWNADYYSCVISAVSKLCNARIGTILHHSFNNWAFSLENYGDFYKDEILLCNDFLLSVDRLQALWWSRRHPRVFCIENPVSFGNEKLLVAGDSSSMGRQERVDHAECEIVWIGRPKDRGKRVELAIEAFTHIAKKDKNARITIVGDIDDVYKRALLGKLNFEVSNRITFVGYVPDTRPYLENATINLVTTLWEVTVPQVILEAQAAGVQTIALDLPVLRNVEGVMCVSSVAEMAEAVLKNVNTLCAGKSRKPLIDVTTRNCEIGSKWNTLFVALKRNHLPALAVDWNRDWRTIENAELLLDEIQRSESAHVHRYVPILLRILIWKGRLNKLKNLFYHRRRSR